MTIPPANTEPPAQDPRRPPVVEVQERHDHVIVVASIPDLRPEDLAVDVTPTSIAISASVGHADREETRTGRRDLAGPQTFGSIWILLSRPIAVASARAELQDGALRVIAPTLPEARHRRVAITTT